MFQYFDPVDGRCGRAPAHGTVPRDDGGRRSVPPPVGRRRRPCAASSSTAPSCSTTSERARLARHFVVVLRGPRQHAPTVRSRSAAAGAGRRADRGAAAMRGPAVIVGRTGTLAAPVRRAGRRGRPTRPALRADGGAVDLRRARPARRGTASAPACERAGVGGRCVVAISLHRSIDGRRGHAGGVSRIGATWVCVDPEHPAELVAYMLADSGAAAVVTSRRTAADRSDRTATAIRVDTTVPRRRRRRRRAPRSAAARPARHLTCLVYTSGSTGTPEGGHGRARRPSTTACRGCGRSSPSAPTK